MTGLPDAAPLAAAHLYPNPAQRSVTVAFVEGPLAGRWVRLLDLTGRQVQVLAAPAADVQLTLDHVRPGCYLVQVVAADGRQRTQRLVVQP